jgi:hypothetical protein
VISIKSKIEDIRCKKKYVLFRGSNPRDLTTASERYLLRCTCLPDFAWVVTVRPIRPLTQYALTDCATEPEMTFNPKFPFKISSILASTCDALFPNNSLNRFTCFPRYKEKKMLCHEQKLDKEETTRKMSIPPKGRQSYIPRREIKRLNLFTSAALTVCNSILRQVMLHVLACAMVTNRSKSRLINKCNSCQHRHNFVKSPLSLPHWTPPENQSSAFHHRLQVNNINLHQGSHPPASHHGRVQCLGA